MVSIVHSKLIEFANATSRPPSIPQILEVYFLKCESTSIFLLTCYCCLCKKGENTVPCAGAEPAPAHPEDVHRLGPEIECSRRESVLRGHDTSPTS